MFVEWEIPHSDGESSLERSVRGRGDECYAFYLFFSFSHQHWGAKFVPCSVTRYPHLKETLVFLLVDWGGGGAKIWLRG
jgi:hypothetical protein